MEGEEEVHAPYDTREVEVVNPRRKSGPLLYLCRAGVRATNLKSKVILLLMLHGTPEGTDSTREV